VWSDFDFGGYICEPLRRPTGYILIGVGGGWGGGGVEGWKDGRGGG
jgi:hypothetical protein